MAEALTTRGLAVTQIEQLPEVLPTVDHELGALVHAELERHGVRVACDTRVEAITQPTDGSAGALEVHAVAARRRSHSSSATDVVLVVVGVRPDSQLAASAGAAARGPRRDPRRPSNAHQPHRHLRRGRLRRHLPPAARRHLPTPRHHRPQTRPHRRRERARRHTANSPAASAHKSSRPSTSSRRGPASAITKPQQADSNR